MIKKVEVDFHGRPLSIEVGRLAKQADGAALVRYGDTVVLVTVVAAKELKADLDFLPLTVDYQEKTFAAGKIPGGFFKREGRPSEKGIRGKSWLRPYTRQKRDVQGFLIL